MLITDLPIQVRSLSKQELESIHDAIIVACNNGIDYYFGEYSSTCVYHFTDGSYVSIEQTYYFKTLTVKLYNKNGPYVFLYQIAE